MYLAVLVGKSIKQEIREWCTSTTGSRTCGTPRLGPRKMWPERKCLLDTRVWGYALVGFRGMWIWIWIWGRILRLTDRLGRSTMTSLTTLHIGWPTIYFCACTVPVVGGSRSLYTTSPSD